MDDIYAELVRIGFRRKEALVYVALLRLGPSTVGQVAKKSAVNRATTYGVLESLKEKELVSVKKQDSETIFVAEPPERIVTMLAVEIEKLEERNRVAKQLVTRLRVFQSEEGSKPKIRYIESIDGLRAMQQEYETKEGDIWQLVGYDAFLALHDPEATAAHRETIERQHRTIRSILVTDRTLTLGNVDGAEVLTISPSLVPIAGEMTVCGDTLVLFSYEEGIIAVEIRSKTIADTARAAIQLAWNEAKRLQTNNPAT